MPRVPFKLLKVWKPLILYLFTFCKLGYFGDGDVIFACMNLAVNEMQKKEPCSKNCHRNCKETEVFVLIFLLLDLVKMIIQFPWL